MEPHHRSFNSDSPHPRDDHSGDWIARPYSIAVAVIGLFILILGIATFLGRHQFETSRRDALANDRTTAVLLADLIQQHNKATIGILQSYARRSLFIKAVKNMNVAGVHRHLSDLKNNAEIDLAFVTDTRGILVANIPMYTDSMGRDMSHRDWYKGVSNRWEPYISAVFKLIVGDKPLAAAVCVPVFDEKENAIGILGTSQRLSFLDDTIEMVPFSPFTTVNVIDRAGQILYSNKRPYQGEIMNYRFSPAIEEALKGKKQQIEISEPQKGREKSYFVVVPVRDSGWTVVIERSREDLLRSASGHFIEIGVVSLLLFLLAAVALVFLRRAYLFRKTEELLQAERKLRQSEHALSESEEHYRMLFNSIDEGFCIIEVIFDENEKPIDYRFLEINPSFEKQTGLIDARGKRMHELAPKHEEYWFEIYGKIALTGEPVRFVNRAEQLHRWYDVYAFRVGRPEDRQVAILFNDITKSRQTQDALRESQAFYHSLVEQLPAGVFRKDREGRFVFVSPWFCRLKGMKEEEFLGKRPQDVIAGETAKPDPKEQGIKYTAEGADHHVRIMQNGKPIELIEEYAGGADGGKQFVHVIKIPVYDSAGKVIGTQGLLFDVTERVQAEEVLKRKEEEARLLARETGIIAKMGWIISSNIRIEEVYGRFSEEVGKVIPFDRLTVNIIDRAQGRVTVAYAAGIPVPGRQPGDVFPLAGSVNELFAAKRSGVLFQPKTDEEMGRLLSQQQLPFKCGLRSQMAVPLISEDQVMGALSFLSKKQDAYGDADLKLGEEIGIQIAGAIAGAQRYNERLWAEKQLQDTLESLRKAVGTTIQVMVSAVETRDPYTSGHQTRSAGLARAIATEMGLPQHKIEGIRMAGSIHDIGKLSIPAEILSKPTKLSDIEFSLIREHARQGYEILKNVESPWPLAEIVCQHHERMDGSGYPRSLKGNEILIEARILAVADVVEAMASHRPYRPGLGIDLALAEIEKNRGIFYDNAVADACLKLFREKGFKLEGIDYDR